MTVRTGGILKILVTGGLGTVGQVLVDELRSRGHDVLALDRSHHRREAGFSVRTDVADPDYVRCDVGSFRQLERVVREAGPFDYVYHTAAEFGRWNGEDYYEQLWRTNAVGTKNVIRLQEREGFRLIQFSSSEVYGDWDGVMSEDVLEEEPIHLLNDYAMSKRVNEMQVINSARQEGTESVIVRLFNLYGPGEYYSPYRSVNCRFVYCALRGIPFVVHRGHERTSTYAEDAARTLANIVGSFHPGQIYNIGGDELHSIETLAEEVLDVTGADEELVSYEDPEPMTTRRKVVDVSRAKEELDHREEVSLHEGLSRTARWMEDVYGL